MEQSQGDMWVLQGQSTDWYGCTSMTEQEWLVCKDPLVMLEYLEYTRVARGHRMNKWNDTKKQYDGGPSERKLRLFACVCCRQVWHLLTDVKSRNVVELAEDYTEGLVSETELWQAWEISQNRTVRGSYSHLVHWVLPMYTNDIRTVIVSLLGNLEYVDGRDYRPIHAALLRDIVGNPFRQVQLIPDWLTWNNGTVLRLADEIYTTRRFDEVCVLADALEDAGCGPAFSIENTGNTIVKVQHTNPLLAHLRHLGPHSLGCWVLDLILGKEW